MISTTMLAALVFCVSLAGVGFMLTAQQMKKTARVTARSRRRL